jgi:deoxyribonuclease-4
MTHSTIKIGPAGNVDKDTISSLKRLSGLGIKAQEIEFVRGVYMKNDDAKAVGKEAKKLDVSLSIHAPYYINLLSREKDKLEASKKRILDSIERGHHLGATYVVFHPGYYQGMDRGEAYEYMKEQILDMQDKIRKEGWTTKLAPETTGKVSQFGDLDQLHKLIKDTKCHYCVDFSHLIAKFQKPIDYKKILDEIKGHGHIHAHFQGIEFTDKGEKKHLITPEEEIKKLVKALTEVKVDITIISESPDPLGDTLRLRKALEKAKLL